MNESEYAGPAWDNTPEYASLDAPALNADLEAVEKGTKDLEALSSRIVPFVTKASALSDREGQEAVTLCQEIAARYEQVAPTLWDLRTYVYLELCVDGSSARGKQLRGRLEELGSRVERALKPKDQLLVLFPQSLVDDYLATEATRPESFRIEQARRKRDQLLSLEMEDLVLSLSVEGHTAWGRLYDDLSGHLRCTVDLPEGPKTMGVAAAAALLESPDEAVRRAAFVGANRAWETQEIPCAAILNALAGWRHAIDRKRSSAAEVHFLDEATHSARIEKKTLEAMMGAVRERTDLGRRVMKVKARALGKDVMGPWDRLAPPPEAGGEDARLRFDDAMALIASSFDAVHPDMGDMVRECGKKRWIEGRVLDSKRQGGFCTRFIRAKTPRIYMTYSGGMKDIATLAHELGHAFHSWKMRDLPLVETGYPMTLAETASIFAETVLGGALESAAKDTRQMFNVYWDVGSRVEALLLNVPSRFDFEARFYEEKKEKAYTPEDFRHAMVESWKTWYGDSLSEMDPMFWASKLHFYISGIRFYNFPYVFGYLFSLGVYAQKETHGASFYDRYVALLRDTGRMTAEELTRKHLDADLSRRDFWHRSLDIVETHVKRFEELGASLYP